MLAWGPHRIGWRLGIARSTVYAVLRRAGLHRLAWLHRTTREIVRYEHARPGALVHLDIKKLGRIPQGGGKRILPGFAENRSGPQRGPRLGFDFLHVAVDDHSRYAYVEALPDERGPTAAAFLVRALAHFERQSIAVERILTDNGACYVSRIFTDTAAARNIRLKRTRPFRPQTNGKAEAFNKIMQAEWAYQRPYYSNDERLNVLPGFLAYYNHRRPHGGIGGATPASRLSTTSMGTTARRRLFRGSRAMPEQQTPPRNPETQPVINSPYKAPQWHWTLNERGAAQEPAIPGRRRSMGIIAVPGPKTVALQTSFGDQADELTLVNDIRDAVANWRARDYPNVTNASSRLLRYWHSDQTEPRLFFAQLEAIETLIYLYEVATTNSFAWGKFAWEKLNEANRDYNDDLRRVGVKMATGTGKTAVMTLTIIWQSVNHTLDPKNPQVHQQIRRHHPRNNR